MTLPSTAKIKRETSPPRTPPINYSSNAIANCAPETMGTNLQSPVTQFTDDLTKVDFNFTASSGGPPASMVVKQENQNTVATDDQKIANTENKENLSSNQLNEEKLQQLRDELQPLNSPASNVAPSSPSKISAPVQKNQRVRTDSSRSRTSECEGGNQAGDTSPTSTTNISAQAPQASLFDYIYSELRRGYYLENDEQRYSERREKFYVFLRIPWELEKFVFYGFLQCCDAILFTFTLLPVRFLLALWLLITRSARRAASFMTFLACPGAPMIVTPSPPTLQPAEICDLIKGFIIIAGVILLSYVDTSVLYHLIKSQSVIKLYIFFNMLEVADKLLSSFGQDILDTLFWTATEPRERRREHLGLIPHLLFAIFYVAIHSLLILLQATTLNVAINSKNKALLTIMMSNNFVEVKGMVFKKFEKNNLYHMSCSDVKERFHYIVLLAIVNVQTLREYNWDTQILVDLLPSCFIILLAEMFIDWFKHAFVTRFNEISHTVYHEYKLSLAYDLVASKLKSAFTDHSDLISRRMGFTPLPMTALVCRILYNALKSMKDTDFVYASICALLVYFILLTWKLSNNIYLLAKSLDVVEVHRSTLEKKVPPPRQCASLPSSRRNSIENLAVPDLKSTQNPQAKSTPHTPVPSRNASLADISAQAHLIEEGMNLEQSMIFSDSTVSLNSLEMNDGSEVKIPSTLIEGVESNTKDMSACSATKQKSILKRNRTPELFRRRVSLQEMATINNLLYKSNDENATPSPRPIPSASTPLKDSKKSK